MQADSLIRLNEGQTIQPDVFLSGEITWINEEVDILLHRSATWHPQISPRRGHVLDWRTADLINRAASLAWARGSFDEHGSIVVMIEDVFGASRKAHATLLM